MRHPRTYSHVIATFALALSASAQSLYQAEFAPTPSQLQVDPVYVERLHVTHPGGGPTFWGFASADTGVVRVLGAGEQGGSWSGISDRARARYLVSDVVFTAPPGVTTTDVYLNTTLSRVRIESIVSPGGASRVNLEIGMGLTGAVDVGRYQVVETNGSLFVTKEGALAGVASLANAVPLVSGPWTVPTNTPLTFEIGASADGYGANGAYSSIRCTFALGHGFSGDDMPYTVFGLQPGIRADSPSAGIVDNSWTPPTEVGFRFCEPLAANSAGQAARIAALGSHAVIDNDLTLVVTGLPTSGTTAFLVNSLSANLTLVNPGGSDGRLCIASSAMGRHLQQVYLGTAGTFSAPLNLTAMPNGPSVRAVLAGETWYWQCWYRDPQLGPGRSNFSAALGVAFE